MQNEELYPIYHDDGSEELVDKERFLREIDRICSKTRVESEEEKKAGRKFLAMTELSLKYGVDLFNTDFSEFFEEEEK